MNDNIIDVHIHFGAPEDEVSGCYWSEAFTKTAAYYAMLLLTKSLFKKVNITRVEKQILAVINKSKQVGKCILLGMDQVYDEKGMVHPEWTHLHTPNRYLAQMAQENDRVLFGASVHPYRKDWREELDFCLANRAVLCKWIPSSQMIKPDHDLCLPFYQKLAEHDLPLLTHAGPEYAIPSSNQEYNKYNNPKYLRKALELGVTGIIAHCALPYLNKFDKPYLDDYEDSLKLFEEAGKYGWRLYADLSAITGPMRSTYVETIQKTIPAQRILYGSDYPIPISGLSYHSRINVITWFKFLRELGRIKNPLDKNYRIIEKMKFDPCIYTNASTLFARIKYN
ncbi:MAG TPA: amidohydrolase family protein [bacterium]|nr:amidohydrolase family protein [bacterium]HQI47069.1 amidohydrolase family protein [bacterium]HQJ65374.1 amidohydrolase family protein [bacterium]